MGFCPEGFGVWGVGGRSVCIHTCIHRVVCSMIVLGVRCSFLSRFEFKVDKFLEISGGPYLHKSLKFRAKGLGFFEAFRASSLEFPKPCKPQTE